MRRLPRLLAPALLALLVGGCAAMKPPVEQRTTQGPRADEMWYFRMLAINGREPNFDERRAWQDDMEARTGAYLREHPEAANSLGVSTFRFYRQVAVGQTREQVLILLGPPLAASRDAADMEKRARRYWPDIKERAEEAWVYQAGWTVWLKGDVVVDLTQYLEPN